MKKGAEFYEEDKRWKTKKEKRKKLRQMKNRNRKMKIYESKWEQ